MLIVRVNGIFMKGIVLILLLLSNLVLFGNPADTTITSFEIRLKRKSVDDPLGFNTCTVDRTKIYNVVMQKIQRQLESHDMASLHNPQVVMKFHDVSGKSKKKNEKELSKEEFKSLKNYQYNYFVKVYGNLDIDSPMNQYQKATFNLKVYIFDSEGKLVHKCRSQSRDHRVGIYRKAELDNNPITEQEFLQLVTKATDSLEIKI
jgi:hypothetical protein